MIQRPAAVMLFSLSLFSGTVGAEALANGSKTGTPSALNTISALPPCLEDGQTLQEIKDTEIANSKNKFKYDGFRKNLSYADDLELQARLTYAETLAANCPGQNKEVSDLVAQVITNRIQKRKGSTKDVIFEPNQFASSLNFYDESRVRDFLCPKDKALWAHVAKTVRQTSKAPSDATNYYFFLHSKKFSPPAWTTKLQTAQAVKSSDGDCVVAYYNPHWK